MRPTPALGRGRGGGGKGRGGGGEGEGRGEEGEGRRGKGREGGGRGGGAGGRERGEEGEGRHEDTHVWHIMKVPAVDNHWAFVRVLVDNSDPPQEVQKGCGMTWHSKVRPGNEVILTNNPRLTSYHLQENKKCDSDFLNCTVKPPIKDILKEDKLPNKGHTKCTLVYTHSVQNNLQKRTISLQKTNGCVPMVSTIRRFHCTEFFIGW